MNKNIYKMIGAGVSFALFIIVGYPLITPVSRAKATADSPCSGFGVQPVSLSTVMPRVFNNITGQPGADCMAWQEFIALNWKADAQKRGYPDTSVPSSAFGTPGDTAPTVWESYWEASSVFNPPAGKRNLKGAVPSRKNLSRISKQGDVDFSLGNFEQAGDNKWLTSQSGNITYYEVLINQDELEYITTNTFSGSDLTTFAGQAACATAGTASQGGFKLPSGNGGNQNNKTPDTTCAGKPVAYGQNMGAVEIKAAWTVLPADHSLDYRYKTATATVVNPVDQKQKQVTVGLVGLHIIHKVPGAPQFVWATFEQIDNCPDNNGQRPNLPSNPNQKPISSYTYYNDSCNPRTDPYQCKPNPCAVSSPDPCVPCDSSGNPKGCVPYNAPMQVVRKASIPSASPSPPNANDINAYVWGLLPAKSVFNYYRLVNVQWPNNPVVPSPSATPPLSSGDIQPSDTIVANTTMETFKQDTACMSCHMYASVASASDTKKAKIAGFSRRIVKPTKRLRSTSPYASDYSFLFIAETVK